MADESKSAGRPSKFDPAFCEQARKLAALGATDLDVAQFFEVDVRTVYRWKLEHEAFCQALKIGKDDADELVESRLFKRATGYSHDAVKIFMPKDATEPVYAPYIEHHAPDVTAAIFWLKNRRPEKWRDRQELTGKDGAAIQHEHLVIDRPEKETREEWLARRRRELGAVAPLGTSAGSTD